MKLILCITVITTITIYGVTAIENVDVDALWSDFKVTHGKQYSGPLEERVRRRNFEYNFQKITEHNKLYEQGLVEYLLTINKFADMTDVEFTNTYNGFKSSHLQAVELIPIVPDADEKVPDKFDWREKGAVTPVKDQGQCGSCWAFSATGSLEGQHFVKSKKLVSISEQNLLDCSHKTNYGCHGGDMREAFQYVHNNNGIDSEKVYPYEAKDLKCRYKVSGNVTSLKEIKIIKKGDEEALKAAIATIGPVSIAIDASQKDFMSYHKGIYYNPKCQNKNLDHGVLAVGYGSENGKDYWLIKNSWSTNWGDEGYIKIARNKDNHCGVATYASIPINY